MLTFLVFSSKIRFLMVFPLFYKLFLEKILFFKVLGAGRYLDSIFSISGFFSNGGGIFRETFEVLSLFEFVSSC